MAWPTVPVGSEDDYTLDVIHGLLAGGRTSRLYRELVLRQGVATSVSASNDTRVDTGVLWLTAECAQGVQPTDLEAAVDAQLQRLSTELVPATGVTEPVPPTAFAPPLLEPPGTPVSPPGCPVSPAPPPELCKSTHPPQPLAAATRPTHAANPVNPWPRCFMVR